MRAGSMSKKGRGWAGKRVCECPNIQRREKEEDDLQESVRVPVPVQVNVGVRRWVCARAKR